MATSSALTLENINPLRAVVAEHMLNKTDVDIAVPRLEHRYTSNSLWPPMMEIIHYGSRLLDHTGLLSKTESTLCLFIFPLMAFSVDDLCERRLFEAEAGLCRRLYWGI